MQPGKGSADKTGCLCGLGRRPECLGKEPVQVGAVPKQVDEQQAQRLEVIRPAGPQPPNAALRNNFIMRCGPWEAGLIGHLPEKRCCLGLAHVQQRRRRLAHRHKVLLEVKVRVEQ